MASETEQKPSRNRAETETLGGQIAAEKEKILII